MKIKLLIPVIILFAFGFNACKKVIDLKFNDTSSKLVIEGNITDQLGPQIVTISRSVALDSSNNFPAVSGAIVKLIDQNGITRILPERTPGTYIFNNYIGKYNQSYTLQIQLDGQTYIATSTMPDKVLIDSVALSVQHFANTTTKTMIISYDDPPNVPNQYRFVMKVNGIQVKQIFARNDQFSNGRYVQTLLYQDDISLQSGDKVDLEMQNIDDIVYNYWYTFSQQKSNGFNSTTPTNPPNNFNSDNILGYFSAHTSQHRNIIIP